MRYDQNRNRIASHSISGREIGGYRVEVKPRIKFLGQVIRGNELEDWEEERRKRKEALDREEQERQDRVKKAKCLENSRKLSNLCR